MKKQLCHYAIVRFLPYTETGEFANVGIVLMCPEAAYFDFRLLRPVRRITAFFEELDAAIYRRAREDFKKELERLREYLNKEAVHHAGANPAWHEIFKELTRPREAMLYFDATRVMLTDDPQRQLEALFAHYVHRNFANKEYQEAQLELHIKNALKAANLIKTYKPETLGDKNVFHVRFPFVKMVDEKPVRVIKPLHLGHDDPTQIYEHGWAWIGKIDKLRDLKQLPDDVLFTVKGPDQNRGARADMFHEVKEKLQRKEVKLLEADYMNEILEFAMQ